jgi:hypothetical protein
MSSADGLLYVIPELPANRRILSSTMTVRRTGSMQRRSFPGLSIETWGAKDR